jgi:predicted  nucleic acid-binding Zn-ribbon protein
MTLTELVGTILLSGTGGVVLKTGIENLLNRRKLGAETDKVDADAASVLSKTALELVEPLGRRIKELEGEVNDLRHQVRAATHELETCHDSIREKDRVIAEQTHVIAEKDRQLATKGTLP